LNVAYQHNNSPFIITQAILSEWCQRTPMMARTFEFNLGQLRSYPAWEFTSQYNEDLLPWL